MLVALSLEVHITSSAVRREVAVKKAVTLRQYSVKQNKTSILRMPFEELPENKFHVQEHITCQKNKCHIRNSSRQAGRQAVGQAGRRAGGRQHTFFVL